MELSYDEAEKLLKISGGHTKLLKFYIKYLQIDNKNDVSIFTNMKNNDKLPLEIWQCFTPFLNDDKDKEKIVTYLEKGFPNKVPPFILDKFVRKLYWKNLLVERDRKLYWRCEKIRDVGREIFGLKES